jgi:hypothetical protein
MVDRQIFFGFSFRKARNPEAAPFGIEDMCYSTTTTGDISAVDYATLALDYIPRIYWAFEAQRRLPTLREAMEPILRGLQARPLPVSRDLTLHLGWCEGLQAHPRIVLKPQIGVRSRVVGGSQLPRSLQNPIPFSLFKRPSFDMHFATLNACLEYAALVLTEPQRERFNSALRQLIKYCSNFPGFWNGLQGPILSMRVVDEALREHSLA